MIAHEVRVVLRPIGLSAGRVRAWPLQQSHTAAPAAAHVLVHVPSVLPTCRTPRPGPVRSLAVCALLVLQRAVELSYRQRGRTPVLSLALKPVLIVLSPASPHTFSIRSYVL